MSKLMGDVIGLEGQVNEHAASRASAHASHAATKVRLGLEKMKKAAQPGAPAFPRSRSREEMVESHMVDWGEEGLKPWLKEPQIMNATPDDIVAYQEKLLDEYNDASVALKLNQPQAHDSNARRRPGSDQGFDPSQMGHLGQRGGR